MVVVVLAEEVDVASIGREGLVFELFEVDELRLVDVEVVEREGVGGTLAVLRDDGTDGAVIERDGVLPVAGRYDRVGPSQFFGRLDPDEIMLAPVEAPSLPVLKHRRYGVGEASLGVGGYEAAVAARHALHVAQVEGGVENALADASTAHDHVVAGGDEVDLHLGWVEILIYHSALSSLTSSVGVYSKSCSS